MKVHHGNLSAMARAMTAGGEEITREGVAVRLRSHELFKTATELRAKARITGPRANMTAGTPDPAGERLAILEAMATQPTYEGAYQQLGISKRTFYRKLRVHGITPAEALEHRRKLQQPAADAPAAG